MDSSERTPLTQLQDDLLVAFFERAEGFFLTGGAALARQLRHRTTEDLDLFATAGTDLQAGVRALLEAAEVIRATVRELRTSVDFRRYEVMRGDERCKVDLVIDRAPQVADKVSFGVVRADTLGEIAANKLCALLDRQEPRDLFDLRLLLAGGISLGDALRDATRKHAGIDPASLAWALSQLRIPATAPVPAGATAAELDAFRKELIDALTLLALPAER